MSDPALEVQVRVRQRITIENYANDADLLAEHVGMEDNFQAGGYGERQIEELLQNAIDQLTDFGRVELRLADGALYCANEGQPFGADGIKAVTGAFLSSKNDEKIGRFGLGFKSVLGVTDRPQIISQSISFGFNEPEATQLLDALPFRPERVPTLRVPSVVDAALIAQTDDNIAEMMEWATTIIKLPLVRGGDRLKKRLQEFDLRYLLFPENLRRVDIVLEGSAGELARQSFQRRPGSAPGLVELESPTGDKSEWRLLRRDHKVSDSIADELPGLFHRELVTVSYALEQGKTGIGEFWAWFPLLDQTTASGIFNAPWQVNDDRTSLLPGSAFNRELLEVAAELLIEAALLESTPSDPAKHFDVLPARGRETRSNADKYMSERIPKLARMNELIPTSSGAMRAPSRVRAPIITDQQNRFALPSEAIRRWAEATKTDDTPHWSCYSNATRAARLAQLLTDENDRVACITISPVEWLSEAAQSRTVDAIDGALAIYLRLKEEKEDVWKQFRASRILPLEGGKFAGAEDVLRVLLPVDGAEVPNDIAVIESTLAGDARVRSKLLELGVREVSPDQIVSAAAASARASWSESEWERLWAVLIEASPAAGRLALESIVARQIQVLVPTKGGAWRTASEVFTDPALVPGILARQPDIIQLRGRTDLLSAAGCADDMNTSFPIHIERTFRKYRESMQGESDVAVAEQFGAGIHSRLLFTELEGVGPLDVLLELSESSDPGALTARARWTHRVLSLLRFEQIIVPLDFAGRAKQQSVTMKSPELWSAEAFGLLDTTLGPTKLSTVLARSLEPYGEMLPVARESYSGLYSLPSELIKAPTAALRGFMQRENYSVSDLSRFSEILAVAATRQQFADCQEIPAIDAQTRRIAVTPIRGVVIASADDLDDLGSHSLRYIPTGPSDDAISLAWSIQRAADVVARSIDWIASSDSAPLLDVFPTLAQTVDQSLDDFLIRACGTIIRRTESPEGGIRESPMSSHLDGRTILVREDLDLFERLTMVNDLLRLRLTPGDLQVQIVRDEALRKSLLIEQVVAEIDESKKLLVLVGREGLESSLPEGLLSVIEQRQGSRSNDEVAQLFHNTHGYGSVEKLKKQMLALGLPVPREWEGSAAAEDFVSMLGFSRSFAGTREKKAAPQEIVPGRVELPDLHEFQKTLRDEIRELTLIREKSGEHKRGLLYLPTGAGKTRVTTESIAAMLRDDEIASPILWVAQSEELLEQAIVSWTEVWRAIGDERELDITRYWGEYEADESHKELQVVISMDAKLDRMIESEANQRAHRWLQNAKLVVIDEAHRAGSPRYTRILRWLGITAGAGGHTDRPLLGLTGTPYRGTNEVVNRQFVARFGDRQLNALDEEDPIGQLREMRVLAKVEHQILDGIDVKDFPTEGRGGSTAWDDISKTILEKLGANLDRTQLLVDHIMRQDPDWPILVFTPSVLSAHVTAALLGSLGRNADAVDGDMRGQERRRKIDAFKTGATKVLVNCDLLAQGFDAPKVRALYIARPTFSPNRYVQMVGRGLRGPRNGGTEECLVVNMVDTFKQFDKNLAYTDFDHLWTKKGATGK